MAVDAANLRAHADRLALWGWPLAIPGAITALREAADLLDTLTVSVTPTLAVDAPASEPVATPTD